MVVSEFGRVKINGVDEFGRIIFTSIDEFGRKLQEEEVPAVGRLVYGGLVNSGVTGGRLTG